MIIAANSRVEKLALLLELREKLEELQVLLRICKEVRAFSGAATFLGSCGQQPQRCDGLESKE